MCSDYPSEGLLVGARGFEPPTSSSRTTRATKLRYAPTDPVRRREGRIAEASDTSLPTITSPATSTQGVTATSMRFRAASYRSVWPSETLTLQVPLLSARMRPVGVMRQTDGVRVR